MSQETYNCFVERLREERKRAGLSQSETARKLKMSQSHYSKVELAKRRLSFYETKWLCETQLDSFYIFTGKRVEKGYGSLFIGCEYRELLGYLELVCMVISQPEEATVERLSASDSRMIEYARYAAATERKDKTVFRKYRDYCDYNQEQMAEELGVDRKKLRDLEKGKLLPDSELIWKMSEQLHVPFSLMLKDSKGLISEICHLLERLEADRRSWLLETMGQYQQKIRKAKGTEDKA